jgi:hypothetical protein
VIYHYRAYAVRLTRRQALRALLHGRKRSVEVRGSRVNPLIPVVLGNDSLSVNADATPFQTGLARLEQEVTAFAWGGGGNLMGGGQGVGGNASAGGSGSYAVGSGGAGGGGGRVAGTCPSCGGPADHAHGGSGGKWACERIREAH